MSILTRLHNRETGSIEAAIDKLRQLEVEIDLESASALYNRLANLGTYVDPEKTPPGVKGFDLGLKSLLILAGHENHHQPEYYKYITDAEGNESLEIAELPRPFNIMIEPNSRDRELQKAFLRGYRLGVYIIGKRSPQIEYLDTYVRPGEESALALHRDSNRALIGRHVTAETIGQRDIGFTHGVFPSNAQEVYSYIVEEVS